MVHYVLTCFVPLIRLLKLVRRFKKLQLLLLHGIQRASVLEKSYASGWAHRLNGMLALCSCFRRFLCRRNGTKACSVISC